jgi:peptide-methionine (R)-S-oxide reductase
MLLLGGPMACTAQLPNGTASADHSPTPMNIDTTQGLLPLPQNDAEWRTRLDERAYYVLRQQGTERPFSHPFWNKMDVGLYRCKACGNPLFYSDSKFGSSCGWPSFFQALDSSRIRYLEDHSHGMHRVEVRCQRCDGHLGHVFDDGPPPTGRRYCINGESLTFELGEPPAVGADSTTAR